LKNSHAVSLEKPIGGYFLWLKINEKVNLDVLAQKLNDNDIDVHYGTIFVRCKERNDSKFEYLKRRMRISFTFLELERFIEGLAKLKKSIEDSYQLN